MSSLVDLGYLGATFLSLIVILDPPGALPIFLALTRGFSIQERAAVARRAAVVAFGVLLSFALLGQQVLTYLKISLPALQCAGGLLLLLVGLELVLGRDSAANNLDHSISVAMVPLAVPLLAGPGVLVAIMVAVQRAGGPAQYLAVLLALVAAMLVVWVTLRFAGGIHRLLHDGGITLVGRIAGLLCSAIAVQMLADGVIGFARAS